MSFYDELRAMLGMEEELPDGMRELDEEGNARAAQRQELADLQTPAPPERAAAFSNPEGEAQWASDRPAAERMSNASEMVKRARQRHRTPDLVTSEGTEIDVGKPRTGQPEMDGRAEVLAAIKKVATPPEEQTETPTEAPGEQPVGELKRRPLGVTGPTYAPATPNREAAPPPDEAEFQAQLKDPNRRIFEKPAGGGGGSPVERLTAQLAMGASDPRTEKLRAALADRTRQLGIADGLDTMASGADIAGGTHYNQPGAYMRAAKAKGDAGVDEVTEPIALEQKTKKFESDMSNDEQSRKLRESADVRAGAANDRAERADQRATADEERKAKGFATAQGKNDPTSETSKNARASAEALYPSIKQKIRPETWEKFSAADVERVFGEVSQKEMAPKGPGRQGGIDERQARGFATRAKLPTASTVKDLNDVLATMDKGNAPGAGYFMNKSGWQNMIRTPAGKRFKQKVQGVVNRHLHDHAGMNVTPGEEERFMSQMGYGNFDDPQALYSGMQVLAEEMDADQNATLSQLPPRSRQMLEEQGATRKIGGKFGTAIDPNEQRQHFDDNETMNYEQDYPRLSKFFGILGTAKKLIGGGGKPGGARNYNLDIE